LHTITITNDVIVIGQPKKIFCHEDLTAIFTAQAFEIIKPQFLQYEKTNTLAIADRWIIHEYYVFYQLFYQHTRLYKRFHERIWSRSYHWSVVSAGKIKKGKIRLRMIDLQLPIK